MPSDPSGNLAAYVLARAIAEAINPARPATTALIGNALFQPLTVRVVELLAEWGYQIERIEPEASAA